VKGRLVLSLIALLGGVYGAAAGSFDEATAKFSITVQKETISYETYSFFVLPGEKIAFEAVNDGEVDFSFDVPEGAIQRTKPGQWSWTAPRQSGIYKIKVSSDQYDDSIRLNAVVMVPATQVVKEHLNGYRIGTYPATPLDGNPIYLKPRGFIEVTEDNEDTRLTPHFKLKQFLCKQEGGYPKYVVLSEKLLLQLERILSLVNRHGVEADTLHVMSGYRTPYYNKEIGNVAYSLHQFGRAADVFIDDDEDEWLDDLNNDEVPTEADLLVFRDMIHELTLLPKTSSFAGGIGLYKATSVHGPFIHVDIRGAHAAWSNLAP
jgi:hypothetical protein